MNMENNSGKYMYTDLIISDCRGRTVVGGLSWENCRGRTVVGGLSWEDKCFLVMVSNLSTNPLCKWSSNSTPKSTGEITIEPCHQTRRITDPHHQDHRTNNHRPLSRKSVGRIILEPCRKSNNPRTLTPRLKLLIYAFILSRSPLDSKIVFVPWGLHDLNNCLWIW